MNKNVNRRYILKCGLAVSILSQLDIRESSAQSNNEIGLGVSNPGPLILPPPPMVGGWSAGHFELPLGFNPLYDPDSGDDVLNSKNSFFFGRKQNKPIPGWEEKNILKQDLMVWVREESEYENVTLTEFTSLLNDPQNSDVQVVYNRDPIKWNGSKVLLNEIGIDNHDGEGIFGADGYSDAYTEASKLDEPIIVGLRSVTPDGFKPLRINDMLPTIDPNYPISRDTYLYWRKGEDQQSAITKIVDQLKKEYSADNSVLSKIGSAIPK